MLLFTAKTKHVCLPNTPLENLVYELLIIIVLMLSRNQTNIEPDDRIYINPRLQILLFAVISEEMETL